MKNLILLHGALGAAKEFDRFTGHLSTHFKLHTFDLSGHGMNNSEQVFSMPLFAADLKRFIVHYDLRGAQIFGYSMGGYVAYTLAIEEPDILGDIMSLGTKLHWDPLIAKRETSKLDPEKIEQKVPKFASYLQGLHLDWTENMRKTVQLMIDLGNGKALTISDFAKIKNKCFIGLGDQDEMVSFQETLDVAAAISNSKYYQLPQSRHPLSQLDPKILSDQIIEFLK